MSSSVAKFPKRVKKIFCHSEKVFWKMANVNEKHTTVCMQGGNLNRFNNWYGYQDGLCNWAGEGTEHPDVNDVCSCNGLGYIGHVEGSAVRKVRAREEGGSKNNSKKNAQTFVQLQHYQLLHDFRFRVSDFPKSSSLLHLPNGTTLRRGHVCNETTSYCVVLKRLPPCNWMDLEVVF